MDNISNLMKSAEALNQSAISFAIKRGASPLGDGTALSLQRAALEYANAFTSLTTPPTLWRKLTRKFKSAKI